MNVMPTIVLSRDQISHLNHYPGTREAHSNSYPETRETHSLQEALFIGASLETQVTTRRQQVSLI